MESLVLAFLILAGGGAPQIIPMLGLGSVMMTLGTTWTSKVPEAMDYHISSIQGSLDLTRVLVTIPRSVLVRIQCLFFHSGLLEALGTVLRFDGLRAQTGLANSIVVALE